MAHETGGQLEQECRSAMEGVRGALINLYSSIESDPATPQVAAKRFGLNKNLAWKFSKIIGAEDPFAAIQHMPGPNGVEIFLGTLASQGAPPAAIAEVRSAIEAFDRVVEVHTGGREDLDMVLDSMGLGAPERQLEISRQLAFRGNSGICGLQAKVRLTVGFLVPGSGGNGTPRSVLIGGFVGLRQLRANVRWPLFKFQVFSGDGGTKRVERDSEIGPRLFDEFCSPNMPVIEERTSERSIEHVLAGGQIGNSGSFDCFFHNSTNEFPVYRTPADTYGEYNSSIILPIEHLVFDMLVHRDLPVPVPQLLVFNRPGGGLDDPSARRDENLLPINQRVQQLVGVPPAVATPLIPRYPEMVQTVYSRLGFRASEFRGYRAVVRWPPMPSIVSLRWTLPERPG